MGTVKGYMDGIDIASYQKDIDVKNVQSDFVITKATQGSWYTNPYFEKKAAQTLAAGKLLGIYHYSEGSDYKKEVEFYISKTKAYLGKFFPALDWEGMSNSLFGKKDVEYCKNFMDYFYEKTGLRMILYVSKSVLRAHDWTPVEEAGYPIWVAQYGANKPTGYQETPWTDDKGWGAWTGPTIYQYSSKGQLSGYKGDLDINKSCITRDQWEIFAAPDNSDKQQKAKGEEIRQIVIYLDPQQMMENLALAEAGYQEKKTNSRLYCKHTNSGSGNWTKYGKEMHKIFPKTMDLPAPWCDCFYDWLTYTLFGNATAQSLLGGSYDDYTVNSALLYQRVGAWHSTPQWMDQVFFSKNGAISGIYHTGAYLWKEDDGTIVTVEGNTSGSAGVDPDGGQVSVKRYKPGTSGYKKIVGYGRPKWSLAGEITKAMPTPKLITKGQNGAAVRLWQFIVGAKIDGDFGPKTEEATKNFQSFHGMHATGIVAAAAWAAGMAKGMISTGMPEIEQGSMGNAVKFLQAILGATVDGDFGPKTDAALKAFQRSKGLDADGCAGANTWAALLREIQ